jgi:hypothetical protein
MKKIIHVLLSREKKIGVHTFRRSGFGGRSTVALVQ